MTVSEIPRGKKVVLFDGVCNLCDSLVQYIIKRDKKDIFRFVSQQSPLGQEILKHIGVDQETNSIVVYEPGIAYHTKSGAVLEIARHLSGVGRMSMLVRIFPSGFRDKLYDIISRNRYKWYGTKDVCAMPTPEMRAKFLDF